MSKSRNMSDPMEPQVEELRVELFNLPADARATIDVGALDRGRWTLGPPELLTGLGFESGVDGGLSFRELTLEPRVLTLTPTQPIPWIRFRLHVAVASEGAALIGGSVDVRGGAHVRFTSRFDRVTVLGHSAWYIRVA